MQISVKRRQGMTIGAPVLEHICNAAARAIAATTFAGRSCVGGVRGFDFRDNERRICSRQLFLGEGTGVPRFLPPNPDLPALTLWFRGKQRRIAKG